ncbi:uncharacterized protein LOC133663088 isoform X2 [Entelurus aequoreus]|uniref:uncharacterized protein LOC133663088 isoform X2 n=1 Tax=Entelurus aequoreus TaxID=161455 RepID=UPI002B1D33CA|nr:uncharacterized protein LOC133663088 isoform X2 [Entelurus aequoreus]
MLAARSGAGGAPAPVHRQHSGGGAKGRLANATDVRQRAPRREMGSRCLDKMFGAAREDTVSQKTGMPYRRGSHLSHSCERGTGRCTCTKPPARTSPTPSRGAPAGPAGSRLSRASARGGWGGPGPPAAPPSCCGPPRGRM